MAFLVREDPQCFQWAGAPLGAFDRFVSGVILALSLDCGGQCSGVQVRKVEEKGRMTGDLAFRVIQRLLNLTVRVQPYAEL